MEKNLEDFIKSVQTLADLRNLDEANPVVLHIEHPISAVKYVVACAKKEPSYLGIPVNSTWVVLDPADELYLRALKLKDVLDPTSATDRTSINGLRWHIIRTYLDIFTDPQYYLNEGPVGPTGQTGPIGEVGPVGPTGPQGETGLQGEPGSRGFIGPQGIQGIQGVDGKQGLPGAVGPIGPTGPTGQTGQQGIPGVQGPVGPTGPQGLQGLQGDPSALFKVIPNGGAASPSEFVSGRIYGFDAYNTTDMPVANLASGKFCFSGVHVSYGPAGAERGFQLAHAWNTELNACVGTYVRSKDDTKTQFGPWSRLVYESDLPPVNLTDGLVSYTSSAGIKYQELLTFAIIADSDIELTYLKTVDISLDDVFNVWNRFSHNNTTAQPASVTEMNGWTYTNGVISNSTNTSTYVGFTSQNVYDTYWHEAEILSTSTDDDVIGLVIAYVVDSDGVQHTLSAVRDVGGVSSNGFKIIYDYAQTTTWVVSSVPAGVLTLYKNPLSGWQNLACSLQVIREGNQITARTTQNYSASGSRTAYVEAATLVLDLNDDPRLAKFMQPCAYGYSTYSQANSSFRNLKFSEAATIYDSRNGDKHVLDNDTGLYTKTTNALVADLGVGRLVHSKVQKKLYYLNLSGALILLARQSRTVHLPNQVIAAGGYIDIDPKVLLQDGNVKPSDCDLFVGNPTVSGVLSGVLAGFYVVQPHGFYVGYNNSTLRVANLTANAVTLDITLVRS